MRIQHFSQHRRVRWQNGKGYTNEVIAHPSGDNWHWRLSLAEVPEDAPFSVFPGVDRAIAVASGAGMILDIDGLRTTVGRYEALTFSGDSSTNAELLKGPVIDMNFMVRRDAAIGVPKIDICTYERGEPVDPAGALCAVVFDGYVNIYEPAIGFPFNPNVSTADHLSAVLFDLDPDERTIAAGSRVTVAFARLLDLA